MKKLNKKGFTLIELLAVIVILALLVAVAIPSITKYLNTTRAGVFKNDAHTAINVASNDDLSFNNFRDGAEYIIDGTNPKAPDTDTVKYVNNLLQTKLKKSPYGEEYSGKVVIRYESGSLEPTFEIYLTDGTNCLGKNDGTDITYVNKDQIESAQINLNQDGNCKKIS